MSGTLIKLTRRHFMKQSALLSAAALGCSATQGILGGAGSSKPRAPIRIGLIGCGGRGVHDAINCILADEHVEIAALGDLFPDRLEAARMILREEIGPRLTANEGACFTGWDAYQHVMACDIDLVMLTAPPHFRPAHLRAAVDAGKHVFMEKPIAVDPVGVRSVISSSDTADLKDLTILAGTQMRRLASLVEGIRRIHDGAIGDISSGQCLRLGDAMGGWGPLERQPEWSDMEWQLRRWLFIDWLSGDFIVEMHVHNLDIVNWALGSHPVKCVALGGRQVRTDPLFGNVFDHFSAEYEYPNGVRIQYMGSQIDGCSIRNDQRLFGNKGQAYLNFGNTVIEGKHPYAFDGESPNPEILQHADQFAAIREGRHLNEGRQIAESTLTSIMGRVSAYTGRTISWNWLMNKSKLDLTPPSYTLGEFAMPPVAAPGITKLV